MRLRATWLPTSTQEGFHHGGHGGHGELTQTKIEGQRTNRKDCPRKQKYFFLCPLCALW